MTIGNGVTSIGYGGFAYTHNITSITFGSGLTSIDSGAFGSTSCTVFDFRNATSIPTLSNVDAFENTSANKKIVVPDSLYNNWRAATNWSSTTNGIVTAIISQTDYESSAKTATTFYFSNGTSTESEITGELTSDILVNLGLKSNYQTWTNCPTRVEIGSGVTRLGHNAFQNGDALTEVTMPDSVLTMGDRVFMDCDHLTTVTLSNNLTEIGKETFKWSAITGMTVPSSVTTIGSNVFAVCNSLNAITFQGKTTTQVQGMTNYNFGLKSGCVVTCSNGTITI